jgi:hypothetical protein
MRALLLSAALAASSGTAFAAKVFAIATDSPVRQIRETALEIYVETESGAFRLEECAAAPLCLTPDAIQGLPEPAPEEALPDGAVAVAPSGDIRRAWYSRPTTRYEHGVLGNKVEGGSLVAETAGGERFELVLPETYVFEDLTPRISDLNGDGRNEVVTIRSSRVAGAAVAIYAVADGSLVERAAGPEIGRPSRWLNIAGIADYTGAGIPAIAWVETPHIGGTLKMGALVNGRLEVFENTYPGFSNHVIGSKELGLSATGDFSGDGVPDLALPSVDRSSLVIASRTGFEAIALPGRVAHAVVHISDLLVTATEDGRLLAIAP